jgi:hypothetical protein
MNVTELFSEIRVKKSGTNEDENTWIKQRQ